MPKSQARNAKSRLDNAIYASNRTLPHRRHSEVTPVPWPCDQLARDVDVACRFDGNDDPRASPDDRDDVSLTSILDRD